jgi:hypothetical protein
MTSKEMDDMQSATSAFVTASQSGRFRFFFPSFETVQYVPANFRAQADVTMLMDVSATATPPFNAVKMIVNVPALVGSGRHDVKNPYRQDCCTRLLEARRLL